MGFITSFKAFLGFQPVTPEFKQTGNQPVGFHSTKTGEKDMYGISQFVDGSFALYNKRTGDLVTTYARKRDAVRGAKRRGLTLA